MTKNIDKLYKEWINILSWCLYPLTQPGVALDELGAVPEIKACYESGMKAWETARDVITFVKASKFTMSL